jgi:hypothetical protein
MSQEKETSKQDERRSTAGRYLLNFLEEVNTLSNWNALYFNIMAEVQFMAQKSGSVEDHMKEMDASQKSELLRQIQETRFYVTKTWTTLQSMKEVLKISKDKELEELEKVKNKLQNEFIMKRDDVEFFTVTVNKFLVKDIIKELLKDNEDLVSSLTR